MSPLATPLPVTAAESVTVVDVLEATVVPAGITPPVVESVTSIPGTIAAGTDAKVRVVPEAVRALAVRFTVTADIGGVAQPPDALKNWFAAASPAAGAGTKPEVPPEPVSPAKIVIEAARTILSSGQGETVTAEVVKTSL